MDSMQPNLITVKEAAAYLRIPIPTVYYLVQKGQLPAVQIGGRWRIKQDELDSQILQKSNDFSKPTAPMYQPQILIVDDEPMIHQLHNYALKPFPFFLKWLGDWRNFHSHWPTRLSSRSPSSTHPLSSIQTQFWRV